MLLQGVILWLWNGMLPLVGKVIPVSLRLGYVVVTVWIIERYTECHLPYETKQLTPPAISGSHTGPKV